MKLWTRDGQTMTDDGRTSDHGYTISSPGEPSATNYTHNTQFVLEANREFFKYGICLLIWNLKISKT